MPPPTTSTSKFPSRSRRKLADRSKRPGMVRMVEERPSNGRCAVAAPDSSHGFVVNNYCKLKQGPDRVTVVKSPAELTELFREQGRKITPQRVSIFNAL